MNAIFNQDKKPSFPNMKVNEESKNKEKPIESKKEEMPSLFSMNINKQEDKK
jgi:hypothetical protein